MEIKVVDQVAQLALAVKGEKQTMESMVGFIDESYKKIMQRLGEQGVQPVGSPYLCYTNMTPDYSTFDLEAGFPIAAEFPVDGELYITHTYAGKSVEATHRGPYSTLEAAYGEIMKYLADNGLESTGTYYDVYLNDPDTTPAEDLLTKIIFVIK